LEIEKQRIELGPGQMFTVPRGIKHRTLPVGSYSVNLTLERANIETVRAEPFENVGTEELGRE
jgi:hypothetical protein